MSGAETLAASALGAVVKFGLEESNRSISGVAASSKNLEYIYDLLNQDLNRLLAVEEDNERQVQRHKHQDTTMVYRSWKKRVSNIAVEVDKLRAKYEGKRLPKWHIFQRSSLSEKMAKRHNQVKDLTEEGRSINILVDYKHPEPVLKVLDAPKIMGYPTLQSALEEILGCLKNRKMKAIGVYGMKGVGKTTVLQNLNNNEEVAELFNMVIFITLIADQNNHKLQQSIADRLKVDIGTVNSCADDIARKIHEELKDKKYLLILDGVVDFINLKQMGIPNNDNGSKVVLASQFLHVCNKNNVDRLIELERLQQHEAWEMFRDVVGPAIDRPGISPTARRVCNRCSRLPLIIHKIASSFKSKNDAPSWRAALEDLDEQWRKHQNEGLEELYSFLTFCYGQLQDKHQKCFLYTSLYPADSKVYIDYLVECWAAQGFLGDINETRRYRKARDSGHMIIGDLVNVSLLEKGERMMYITISGCMRQLALYILSKHPQYNSYVHTNEESEGAPISKIRLNAKWVSMIDTKVHDLSTSEDCSMLQTLLLQKNSELATIPQAFFENMSNVLVLDLYGTGIRELPSSVSKLIGLKGLYLNACKHLRELPPEIASLQFLVVLDIRGSQVSFIPSYIGNLSNLRCLRVPYIKSGNQSDHQGVKAANYDVISKLKNLEELIIEVISYEQWCNQAENVMEQVALLQRLTTLSCTFPSSKILTDFIAKRKLRANDGQFISFQFFVGCQNSKRPLCFQYFEDGLTKYLKYYNGVMDDAAIVEVLRETEAFELICHKDITKLSDFGIESLNLVRGCLIEKCNKISTIVAGERNGLRSGSILPNLEQLYLRNLPRLKYVFKGILNSGTFCKLHTLEVENCSQLKSIFYQGEIMGNDGIRNASILPNLEKLYLRNIPELKCVFGDPLPPGSLSRLQILTLQNCSSLESIFANRVIQNFLELRKIEIQDCSKIEELVVVIEDIEREGDVLPTLEKLELTNLPNLQFICKNKRLAWSSLELLKIHECPNMKSLPFSKDKAAKLRSIKGEQEWWNKLEETMKEICQGIFVATDG